ncbi:MAG: DDE-type integrase/transposase/recombinase [Emcibacter sp.]|nr:DDE-type integrase/transposase/recombinase [Emcibacter sp.]
MTKRRNKKVALKVLKSLIKRYGRPTAIVTDKLKSYKAAMKELGCQNSKKQEAD